MGTLYEINVTDGRQTKAQKFGDTSNYAEFKTDGELNLFGTAKVRKSFFINPTSFHVHYWDVAGDWNGGAPWAVYVFPTGGYNELHTQFNLPGDYDSGLRIRFWIMSNTGTNNIYWQCGAIRAGIGDGGTIFNGDDITNNFTHQNNSATLSASSWWEMHSSFATAPEAYDLIGFEVKRDDNHASDTFAGSVFWLGIEIQYISKSLGEAT